MVGVERKEKKMEIAYSVNRFSAPALQLTQEAVRHALNSAVVEIDPKTGEGKLKFVLLPEDNAASANNNTGTEEQGARHPS